jgi:hypothetical protein
MYLVVHASGKFWDGYGWSTKGRAFLSPATATRSLHEEGEDLEEAVILPSNIFEETEVA